MKKSFQIKFFQNKKIYDNDKYKNDKSKKMMRYKKLKLMIKKMFKYQIKNNKNNFNNLLEKIFHRNNNKFLV